MDSSQDTSRIKAAQNDELSHASLTLAKLFDGVVITDADLEDPVEAPARFTDSVMESVASIAPPLDEESLESEPIDDDPVECDPVAADPPLVSLQLERNPVQRAAKDWEEVDAPLRVSLNQLREWYVIARDLGRSDRLLRIAQLGSQFKQLFGEVDPDEPQAFGGWSLKEVNWWIADRAAYEQEATASSRGL